HLPVEFAVVRDYPKQSEPPTPPYRPKSELDFQPYSLDPLARIFMPGAPTAMDPNEPSIRKTNTYQVKYSCKSLKHAMVNEFNSIILEYKSVSKMKSFKIDYIINAGNVPQVVEGTLNVVYKHN
ncbi:MAG: hypothetical protein M3N14_12675, partial [Bacteroidota bacterium]|nr:hypothetical protein [Bacteroidota bacterium]